MERRLAAIFSADVKGYSRLMGDDEVATVQTIKRYRVIMEEFIGRNRGRVVDSKGDNLLAEFPSVVDAVQAAVAIQKEIGNQNQGLPEKRRMEFRIGINLGDVIVDGGQIYGDGVNIAARLESLAEPGGVSVSGTAYDQIETKLGLGFIYRGRQEVKNIKKPVRVYQVLLDPEAKAKGGPLRHMEEHLKPRARRGPGRVLIFVLIFLAILGGGIALGWYYNQHTTTLAGTPPPNSQDSTTTTIALPELEQPDRPSLVVLPFVNMSGDQEQEYFSDGMTEDLITDLSKIGSIFVISRNSSFSYKGRAVRVEQVSRELGVRYVLEGSVRKAGSRVRITAQLIEGRSGYHVWAERYDRELKDIFVLQDEVTQKIVEALSIRLAEGEKARVLSESAESMMAYDLVLRGRDLKFSFLPEDIKKAQDLFERALALDPGYGPAHVGLGWAYINQWSTGMTNDAAVLDKAKEQADLALEDNPALSEAYILEAWIQLWRKNHDQAVALAQKAVEVAPNDSLALSNLASILVWADRPQEALEAINKAVRLNPLDQEEYVCSLAHTYIFTGRVDEAIRILEKRRRERPRDSLSLFLLANAYARAGRTGEARDMIGRLMKLMPNYTPEMARERMPYKNPEYLENLLDILDRKGPAGPDQSGSSP